MNKNASKSPCLKHHVVVIVCLFSCNVCAMSMLVIEHLIEALCCI